MLPAPSPLQVMENVVPVMRRAQPGVDQVLRARFSAISAPEVQAAMVRPGGSGGSHTPQTAPAVALFGASVCASAVWTCTVNHLLCSSLDFQALHVAGWLDQGSEAFVGSSRRRTIAHCMPVAQPGCAVLLCRSLWCLPTSTRLLLLMHDRSWTSRSGQLVEHTNTCP